MTDIKAGTFAPQGHSGPTHIRLENPVAANFEEFIVGNAMKWEQWTAKQLEEDAPDVYLDLYERGKTLERMEFNQLFRQLAARHCKRKYMVPEGFCRGQHVVICGAGPSLREHAVQWTGKANQVWGCNSALPWLASHGRKVTHGFTVDQQAVMAKEWHMAPDVQYMVASSCHPHLVEYLEKKGRHVQFFHNFVGIKKPPVVLQCPSCGGSGTLAGTTANATCDGCQGSGKHGVDYEDWLYMLLFAPSIRAGSGLNTVTRAVDVALYGAAEKITVLGADHALRYRRPPPKDVVAGSPEHMAWLKDDVTMHADGGNALRSGATAMTLEGWICPDHNGPCECRKRRLWITKPDMVISAVFLEMMRRRLGADRLNIVGDVLPNALRDKDDDFLMQLPHLIDSEGKPVKIW